MGQPSKYSPELRERAVRMVFDHARLKSDSRIKVALHRIAVSKPRLIDPG